MNGSIETGLSGTILSVDYELLVSKGANNSVLFTEADLVTNTDNTLNNSETETKDVQEQESYTLAIVLGVLFGVVGLSLIIFIIYKNYMKKKLRFKKLSKDDENKSMKESAEAGEQQEPGGEPSGLVEVEPR